MPCHRDKEERHMAVEMATARSGVPGSSVSPVEHLHLHMRRTHWETKHHADLGPHLQDALDHLDKEGWEVVTAFTIERTPEIILKRARA
jgi:hypothetical protein